MNLIAGNPYRMVGLLAGASAKDQDRQVRRLKQFIEAGATPEDNYSFPVFGEMSLTVESVAEASSRLNLDRDKMEAALFWFYDGNAITDEPAFLALKDADIGAAQNVWTKLASSHNVTKRNASAFHNLSILLFASCLKNKNSFDIDIFNEALKYALMYLDSAFVTDLKAKATDETFSITKEEIQLLFLNSLYDEIKEAGLFEPNVFIQEVSQCSFAAKEAFLADFIKRPIREIESKIDSAKMTRKAGKEKALKAGSALFDATMPLLHQIEDILGVDNVRYTSLADKVAEEILQCGIDHFQHFRDDGPDPGVASMEMIEKARSIAQGNLIHQRCDENEENLQEWIDDKPVREKQVEIKDYLDELMSVLNEFDNAKETVSNANLLIRKSSPILSNIGNVLGKGDDFYLSLSTRVAMQAQSYIIEEVNETQAKVTQELFADRFTAIHRLKEVLRNAWQATLLLATLDMEYEFKSSRYNPNRETLKGLCRQLNISVSSSGSTGSAATTRRPATVGTSKGTSSEEGFSFANNAWWILGLVGFIIGMMADLGGGSFLTLVFGIYIGSKLSD